jgi:hypothetical protein
MNWGLLFLILGGALIIWLSLRQIRSNPEAFSTTHLNKSALTLGILALCLIAFIAFVVLMLNQTQ